MRDASRVLCVSAGGVWVMLCCRRCFIAQNVRLGSDLVLSEVAGHVVWAPCTRAYATFLAFASSYSHPTEG